MCDGWSIPAGKELAGHGIEGQGIFLKKRDIEHRFGVGQVEAGEIGIDASLGGAIVGDTSRCADTRSSLCSIGVIYTLLSNFRKSLLASRSQKGQT